MYIVTYIQAILLGKLLLELSQNVYNNEQVLQICICETSQFKYIHFYDIYLINNI